jgi:hypothetical protein
MTVVAPQPDSFGLSVDGTARVGLVNQDPSHRQRVPIPPCECRNPFIVQLLRDTVATRTRNELLEDCAHDIGLLIDDLATACLGIVAVAVASFSSALRQLPSPGPLQLATHRPLGYLLPLHLTDKGPRGQDEPTYGGVLEFLSHELQPGSGLFDVIEEDSDVVLVP